MTKTILNLICILILLLVSGCGREPCKRKCNANGKHCMKDCGSGGLECVDADDWGYPKIHVPADAEGIIKAHGGHVDRKDLRKAVGTKVQYAPFYHEYFKAKLDYVSNVAAKIGAISGEYPNQSTRAIDSGQIILHHRDVPIVIAVGRSDQWTSWFGGEANRSPSVPNGDFQAYDHGRSVQDRECKYKVTNNQAPSRADAPNVPIFGLIPGVNDGPNRFDLSPSLLWQDADDPTQIFYLNEDFNYQTVDRTGPVDDPYPEAYMNRDTTGLDAARGQGELFLKANGYTPCQFRYGMGLYVGFAPTDSFGTEVSDIDVINRFHIPDIKRPGTTSDDTNNSPNTSFEGQSVIDQQESNVTASLNAARGIDNYIARGPVDQEFPGVHTGDQLFFKIIDRYYIDNEGGYTVKLKEGTRSPKSGPIEKIVNFFIEPIKEIMQRMYIGIVEHRDFIYYIRVLLALYIMIWGFSLIMGKMSQEELRKDAAIRIFKVCVIITLIGPDSWRFFSNHLFYVFTDSIDGIAALLLNPFKNYDPTSPWFSMDDVLAKMFSGETGAKISSTLFSNFPLGVIYIVFLYLAMILFFLAVIKAVIVYIIAFIAIAILIALAPIFFIAMLFDKTKFLVQEWWNNLVAFSVQQLILMTALGMFAALILMYMERTIGYKVCWNVYARFDFIGVNANLPEYLHLFDLKFWMPDISTHMTNIWMDVDNDGFRRLNPVEFAYRYEDLPYFDPVTERETIADYMTEKNFLSFVDFLVFMLAVVLMLAFMDFIPTMAEALKGGDPKDTASIFGPAQGLHFTIMNGFKEFGQKAWNIGTSKNAKNLMDEVVGFWEGTYSTRGLGPLKKIKRQSIASLTGARGASQRLRDPNAIQDGMYGTPWDGVKDKGSNILEKEQMRSAMMGNTMATWEQNAANAQKYGAKTSTAEDAIKAGRKKEDGRDGILDIFNKKSGGKSLLDKANISDRNAKNLLERGKIAGVLDDSLLAKGRIADRAGIIDNSRIQDYNKITGQNILGESIAFSRMVEKYKSAVGRNDYGSTLLEKAMQKSGGDGSIKGFALTEWNKGEGSKNKKFVRESLLTAIGTRASRDLFSKAGAKIGNEEDNLKFLLGSDEGLSLLERGMKKTLMRGEISKFKDGSLSNVVFAGGSAASALSLDGIIKKQAESKSLSVDSVLAEASKEGSGVDAATVKKLQLITATSKGKSLLDQSIQNVVKDGNNTDIMRTALAAIDSTRDKGAIVEEATAINQAQELLDKLGFRDGKIDVQNLSLKDRKAAQEFIESDEFDLLPMHMQEGLYSALTTREKEYTETSYFVSDIEQLSDARDREFRTGAAFVLGTADKINDAKNAGKVTTQEEDAIIEASRLMSELGASGGALDRNSLNVGQRQKLLDFVQSSEFKQLPSGVQEALYSGLGERQKLRAGVAYALEKTANTAKAPTVDSATDTPAAAPIARSDKPLTKSQEAALERRLKRQLKERGISEPDNPIDSIPEMVGRSWVGRKYEQAKKVAKAVKDASEGPEIVDRIDSVVDKVLRTDNPDGTAGIDKEDTLAYELDQQRRERDARAARREQRKREREEAEEKREEEAEAKRAKREEDRKKRDEERDNDDEE